MINKLFSMMSAFCLAFASVTVQADMITDAQGNVGYDTAAECDAAVSNGTAKFYQPFTHKQPLLREGEKGVQQAKISDLGTKYQHGACDLGSGPRLGRDGVSTALQGKYVPYSPDMPINAYTDKNGSVVRVTMGQCDNWFSDNAPRPVAFSKPTVTEAKPEPIAEPEPMPEPEVAETAPVEMPTAIKAAPYVFGTLGMLHDGVRIKESGITKSGKPLSANDSRFAGQVGIGIQINDTWGGELFYQGSRKNYYEDMIYALNRTFGARATVGKNITDKARVFAKVGAAGVQHTKSTLLGKGKMVARPTLGVGITYDVNDNWAVRGDYDHIFKLSDAKRSDNKGAQWKGSNYLGAGIQYKF